MDSLITANRIFRNVVQLAERLSVDESELAGELIWRGFRAARVYRIDLSEAVSWHDGNISLPFQLNKSQHLSIKRLAQKADLRVSNVIERCLEFALNADLHTSEQMAKLLETEAEQKNEKRRPKYAGLKGMSRFLVFD